jgi:hypothetical protein
MINIVWITVFLSITLHAGFMDSVGDLVESTLSTDQLEVEPEVTTVGTLSVTAGSNHEKESMLDSMVNSVKDSVGMKKEKVKESSMIDDMIDSAKETIGIKEEKSKKSSLLDDTLTAMKEVTGMESKKKDKSYFDDGIMADMADMINLEKGENLGLPSVFGLNKKKEKKVFGSTVLGETILGDVKETGTTFYKGFKTTGESTELMSGMMYKSSKVYNEMFHIFDDSPFNIFEDEDENSILDVFEKGNDVLDVFD